MLENREVFNLLEKKGTNIKTLLGPCQCFFFGGARGGAGVGTSCRTLNFQEETGNLKKKRLRIHEDSVMSCERFVRKLLLCAYCHLMTQ